MPPPAITPRNFWLVFGGAFLAVGVPFLAIGIGLGIGQARLAGRLESEGRSASGLVLTKEFSGKDFARTYRVSYRFSAGGGEQLTRSAEIEEGAWDALEERGPIQVTYLPGDPRSQRVAGERSELFLPAIFGIVGGILTILGATVVLRALSARRRRDRG